MSNGHSWPNIKTYTLSEIGVFIRSIYEIKESERVDKFTMDWMSANLSKKGMEKFVKDMKTSSIFSKKNTPKTKEDVSKEWLRLAAFKQG